MIPSRLLCLNAKLQRDRRVDPCQSTINSAGWGGNFSSPARLGLSGRKEGVHGGFGVDSPPAICSQHKINQVVTLFQVLGTNSESVELTDTCPLSFPT
ncbi:hypothetical protein JHK82_044409 [Glycine max]|nr:hypothetical protein JHK82_044409 [Glycine max]